MTEENKPEDKNENEDRERANDSDRIKDLRERLYSRGGSSQFVRHELTPTAHTTPSEIPKPQQNEPPTAVVTQDMSRTSRTSFRMKLLALGAVFLIGALIVSAALLFMGTNTISGNNISIDVAGPVAVGGGDVMDLQIAIANRNTLPIESATLIITYPDGTQSVTESGKELFTDRQQLNNIDPNEVVNVPIRFMVFGEENDEKEVKIAVEYRVRGSNATFYKEALPFGFKVSSSPIHINVAGVESISSGQELALTVEVQSNSKETLHDLLFKIEYPQGFDFTDAEPETASGQDTWKLPSLKPGEKHQIKLRGVMVGNENDTNRFTMTVGVANERDELSIVSPLAVTTHELRIEKPFLDIDVVINGNRNDVVIIDPDSTASVNVNLRNALDATIYDGEIHVALSGNALDEVNIRVDNGFYDSSNNTIRWDAVDIEDLREISPGTTERVSFTIEPRRDIQATPEIKLSVTTKAKRVGENRAPEELVGSTQKTIKLASATELKSSALYTEGPFNNSGPIPPVAEETTQYTFLLTVKNGTNPVTDAEVTAVMPQYVSWLDMVSDDAVTYSASNRTLKWRVDELDANEYKEVWVQVGFTPSLSQVDLYPTLLETQRYRATDRFTGTVIRAEAPALTTHLVNDPDEDARDGRVQQP